MNDPSGNSSKIDWQVQQSQEVGKTMPVSSRYRLLQKLGEGGMGIVFKAHDPGLDRIVALKVLKSGSPISKKRFLREARATAALQHPNIVKLYEFGEVQGQLFLSMEYVEGSSLSEVNAQDWPFKKVLELMIEICGAIEYSHARGVIHRDLKSSNILLTPGGSPKIMDFGLARLSKESTRLSQEGAILGTLSYMAPEQAHGNRDIVDCRSDVYSLGCILYELLVGQPPFVGNAWEVLYKIAHENPSPPSRRKAALKIHGIDEVCLKALEKERFLRYPDVRSFQEDLERIRDHRSPARSARDGLRKASRFYRSIRRPLAFFLLAILAGTLWFYLSTKEEIPLAVHLEAPRQSPCYSLVDAHVKIENTGGTTLDFFEIFLDLPHGMSRYKTDLPKKTFSLSGKTAKIIPLRLAVSIPGRHRYTVTVWQNRKKARSVTGELESFPSRYGLPHEISRHCLFVFEGREMLDMSCAHWQQLTASSQQEHARTYQQGYAIQMGHDLEKTVYRNGVAFEFVLVPPGRFLMGMNPESTAKIERLMPQRAYPRNNWTPASVALIERPFYLGKGEVTQKQWKSFMSEKRFRFKGEDLPVNHISFLEIERFCQQTGFDLPEEKQWEYACRAGSTGIFYWGDEWEKGRCNTASYWLKKDWWHHHPEFNLNHFDVLFPRYGTTTFPAGKFPPNAFGLYDMLGSVTEWCKDRFDVKPQAIAIRRGGAWYNPILYNTCSYRSFYAIDREDDDTSGFRIVWPMIEGKKHER